MTEKRLSGASTPSRILSALRELIRALDRRVPHPERAGEIRIAGDAQILRREAVARIEELQRAGLDDNLYDQELVEAIMTDDGGPGQAWGDMRAQPSGRTGPAVGMATATDMVFVR